MSIPPMSFGRRSESLNCLDDLESDGTAAVGPSSRLCYGRSPRASRKGHHRCGKHSLSQSDVPKIGWSSNPRCLGKENGAPTRGNKAPASERLSQSLANASFEERRRRALESLQRGSDSVGAGTGKRKPSNGREIVGRGRRSVPSFRIYRSDDEMEPLRESPRERSAASEGLGRRRSPVEGLRERGSKERNGPPVEVPEDAPPFDVGADGNGREGSDSDSYGSDEHEKMWEEQTLKLASIFPDVDPTFLKRECMRMKSSLDVVTDSVLAKVTKNQVPTRADSAKRSEADGEHGSYYKNITVEKLLKVIPDPWTYFGDRDRECRMYADHSLHYLKTKFRKHYVQTISDTLSFHNSNLYLAYKYLMKKNRGIRLRATNRSMSDCNANRPVTVDVRFLLEVAFIENEEKVRNHVKIQTLAKRQRWKEAAKCGTLFSCSCCAEDRILAEDVVRCPSGHVFCKICVIKSVTSEMESGNYQFKCLDACRQVYTLHVMQDLVKPDTFSALLEANLVLGINSPGMEDLVRCPFCSAATLLQPGATVIVCLNAMCMRESCRFCKKGNHLPENCDGSRKVEQVRAGGVTSDGFAGDSPTCGEGSTSDDGAELRSYLSFSDISDIHSPGEDS